MSARIAIFLILTGLTADAGRVVVIPVGAVVAFVVVVALVVVVLLVVVVVALVVVVVPPDPGRH